MAYSEAEATPTEKADPLIEARGERDVALAKLESMRAHVVLVLEFARASAGVLAPSLDQQQRAEAKAFANIADKLAELLARPNLR